MIHDDRYLQGTLIGMQKQIEAIANAVIGRPYQVTEADFTTNMKEVRKRLGMLVPEYEPLGKELYQHAQARENERLRRG